MIYKEDYTWIGEAIQDLHILQDSFRYYQHQQEQLKRDLDSYDSYNSNEWDKDEWEIAYQYKIADDNKRMLKAIQKDIIELKKIIRQLNQEQNKKYNNNE